MLFTTALLKTGKYFCSFIILLQICMQLVENVKWKNILLLKRILVGCVPSACPRPIVSYIMSGGWIPTPLDIPTPRAYPPPEKGSVTRDTYACCGQTDMWKLYLSVTVLTGGNNRHKIPTEFMTIPKSFACMHMSQHFWHQICDSTNSSYHELSNTEQRKYH